MKTFKLKTLVASAILGGLASNAAFADEPGVVRISDRVTQTAGVNSNVVPAPLPSEITGEGLQRVSKIEPIPEGNYVEGEVIYLDEHGNRIAGPYGHVGRNGRQYTPKTYKSRLAMRLSGDPYAISLPADYGFVPPTAWPYVEYAPTTYQRWVQTPLYGTPGMTYTDVQLPMVHTPTDTTQLGYNYMYVPQWQPNPNMFPHAPNPVMWERRVDWRAPHAEQQWNGLIIDANAPKPTKVKVEEIEVKEQNVEVKPGKKV